MTIGVIFCAYNAEDQIHRSLTPWVEARKGNLGGHTFKIAVVSVPFIGFEHPAEPDSTHRYLHESLIAGHIDHVIASHEARTETEARGEALRWLVEQGVEISWMCDGDEIFTKADILGAAHFVEGNPWIQSFRICYRNLVFDERHYLAEPFTPYRIHRVRGYQGYKACGFYDDNNIIYRRPWLSEDAPVLDTMFSSVIIPPLCANPLHYTWLSDERSRLKEKYQRTRWGHCSFRWNYQTDTLEFDPAYFAARGLPLPEVISLDSSHSNALS